MRDMFDEFLREVRRQQEERQGKKPGEGRPEGDGGGEPPENRGEEPVEPPAEDSEDEPRASEPPEEEEENEPRRPFGGRSGGPFDPFGRGGYGGRPRRPVGTGNGEPPFSMSRRSTVMLGVLVAIVLAVVLFGTVGIGFVTDAIWYQSVGFANVFWTRIGSQIAYFLGGTLIAVAFLWLNIWLAGRFAPRGDRRSFSLDDLFERFSVDRYADGMGYRRPRPAGPAEQIEIPDFDRPVRIALLVIAALAALSLGGLLASSWSTIQLWAHQTTFGAADPIFHNDVGFYFFQLPFLRLAQSYGNSLLLLAFALAGVRYLLAVLSGAPMPTAARVHLAVLLGAYLLSIAVGYQLDKLELVYSSQGVVTGVSYTDQNAKFTALDLMTLLAILAAGFLVGFAWIRLRFPFALTLLIWFFASIGLGTVYPLAIQRFVVEPDQQTKESQYIANNIAMTRLAFGIDKWGQQSYQGTTPLSQQTVTNEAGTFQNVRLWDTVPLRSSLDQLEQIRQYYTFNDVDTDRYTLNGQARQVMLGGRELDPQGLESANGGSLSWVNSHITYTHGMGAAMVPVNTVSSEGWPTRIIGDLPPQSQPGAPTITQPRIYFGTTPSDWVIVGATSDEFDYGTGSGADKTNRWTGNTGIKLGNVLTRLLFSARFGDLNMLISDQIHGNSQLLFHRSITERAQLIAPFLSYDSDPYLVVTSDGRLDYVLDGYTTSDAFPNAQRYTGSGGGLGGQELNYVRNSVKVVMDAYDGTMTFYVADPTDPIIRAYEGVFPDLFRDMSSMSADLKAHLRYPEDMFNAQTSMFQRYHLQDPAKLYSGADLWEVPSATAPSGSNPPTLLPLQAFYVEMRMPGEPNSEFMLLQPMVPKDRPNMIAWVAARMDPGKYGEVRYFQFPASTSVFGPQQILARILNDPIISPQLTLWGQSGSGVILGNLLVVPVQDSIVYIEPIYVQSTNANFPEFRKVVVASPTRIVWGDTLDQAVGLLLAGGGTAVQPGTSPSPGASGSPGASPSAASPTPSATASAPIPSGGTAQQLLDEANRHYEAAQAALKAGDLATYQREIDAMGAILRQLQGILGTPLPSLPSSPASSASASASASAP